MSEVTFTALFDRLSRDDELFLVIDETTEHRMSACDHDDRVNDSRFVSRVPLPRGAAVRVHLVVKTTAGALRFAERLRRRLVPRGHATLAQLGHVRLCDFLTGAWGAFQTVDALDESGLTHVAITLGGLARPADSTCFAAWPPAEPSDLSVSPDAILVSPVRFFDAQLSAAALVVRSDAAEERQRRFSLAELAVEPLSIPFTTARPLDAVRLALEFFSPAGASIARAWLLGSNLRQQADGFATLPLVADGGCVVGELVVYFAVITSLPAPVAAAAAEAAATTVRSIWKTVPCEDVGHRGSGAHNARSATNSRTWLDENTMLSFTHAAENQLPFIEFDVQLSRDGVPVIWHDFVIRDEHGRQFSLRDLTLAQFKQLHPLRLARPKDAKFNEYDASVERAHAAPADDVLKDQLTTLDEIFAGTPKWLGFDVELKYPNVSEAREQFVHLPPRNEFVDAVLAVVFARATQKRRIFFSTFDPEVALLLHMKQTVYPVLFLTEGGFKQRSPFDVRTATFEGAVRFARRANLAGVVTRVTPLLAEPALFALTRRAHLLLGTFGWENNDLANVALQEREQTDFVVSDHIATYAERKPEMARRARLLAAET